MPLMKQALTWQRINKMADFFGWNVSQYPQEKTYRRGNVTIKAVKIKYGWKVFVLKYGKVVGSDVVNNSGMAKTLLGEELFLREVGKN